jgi:hypothetical protein
LARYLTKHAVTLAIQIGLDRATNGELIRTAEERGFDVLVTSDKNVKHQQNLRHLRIAVLVLPSGRWPEVKHRLEEIIEEINVARPGTYIEVLSRRA